MASLSKIDISENTLRNRGRILDILLSDKTKSPKKIIRNIIWATDSYRKPGKPYAPYASKEPMLRDQITGKYGMTIQPRAAKSREEQKYRTKDKAEVFTPLSIVKKMNKTIDEYSKNFPVNKENWIDYISEKRLEITCGEAPYITTRYSPTANTGVVIKPNNRVGFLDRKLQMVNKFVDNKKDWLFYAEIALKSCYGYEWQGDNLLIARENILQTTDDFYRDKFGDGKKLSTKQLEHFAEIISWNIWQMDGIKYVIPMSCKKSLIKDEAVDKNQLSILPVENPKKRLIECEGCRTNNPHKHTGRYSKIMDWSINKKIKFRELINVNKNG